MARITTARSSATFMMNRNFTANWGASGRTVTTGWFPAAACVSSSGTFAGLILGKALFELNNWTVTGIPVSDSVEYFEKDVRSLIDRTIAEFGLRIADRETGIHQIDGYIGQGYAMPTREGIETLKLVARSEGIFLDPTYTSKAMAGFLDVIRKKRNRQDALPVFIHTGGVFGLMARRDLFPANGS